MENPEFDQEIDDILNNKLKKKKINSGAKGHRGEHGVCKLLSERFNGRSFERVMGSGNRWAQVKNLPQHAKDTLLGDICAPEGFLWVLEVKNGYEKEVDFYSLFKGKNAQIDEFTDQAVDESRRTGKPAMIFYKRSRRPWLAMMLEKDLPSRPFHIKLLYGSWAIVGLVDLLQEPDSYFFSSLTT